MIVKAYRYRDTLTGSMQWDVMHKREGHWPIMYHYFGDPPKTVQKWIASPARTVHDSVHDYLRRAGSFVTTIWS